MRRLVASVDGPPAMLSVRDRRLRVVARGVGRLVTDIDDDHYVVDAVLPSGRPVQHVIAPGPLPVHVVLDGGPRRVRPVDQDTETSVASVQLLDGRGSVSSDGDGSALVSPGGARPGSVALRLPDDPIAVVTNLPRSDRWGARLAISSAGGRLHCTALTTDPRFETAMGYQAAGLEREAAAVLGARGLGRLRDSCAEEPVAAAHLAHLTRHLLDEDHRRWLFGAASRYLDDVDLAVAAADLAFHRGEEAMVLEFLAAVDAARRPIFTRTLSVAIHLARRLIADAEDQDGVRVRGNSAPVAPSYASDPSSATSRLDRVIAGVRHWTSLARRADPLSPTLTVRSSHARPTVDSDAVDVVIPVEGEPPEHWAAGRVGPLRESLANLVAMPEPPDPLLDAARGALELPDLDGVRRAVERVALVTADDRRARPRGALRRALLDVLDDASAAFPLSSAGIEQARHAVRTGSTRTGLARPAVVVPAASSTPVAASWGSDGRGRLVSLPPYAVLLSLVADGSVVVRVGIPPGSTDAYETGVVVPIDIVVGDSEPERWWVPVGAVSGKPGVLTIRALPGSSMSLGTSELPIALDEVHRIPDSEFQRSLEGLELADRTSLQAMRVERYS